MEDLMGFFVFLVICFVVSNMQKKGKQAKKANPANRKAATPARDGNHPAPHSVPDRALPFTPNATEKAPAQAHGFRPMPSGSLEADSAEGRDPCHDDPYAMPTGSLGTASPEGVDPCHDDPYAMPTGSLGTASPEGVDPCHDDPVRMSFGSLETTSPEGTDPCHPAPDAPPLAEDAGDRATGPHPGFGAGDIVQGFVWGEILNRKRA